MVGSHQCGMGSLHLDMKTLVEILMPWRATIASLAREKQNTEGRLDSERKVAESLNRIIEGLRSDLSVSALLNATLQNQIGTLTVGKEALRLLLVEQCAASEALRGEIRRINSEKDGLKDVLTSEREVAASLRNTQAVQKRGTAVLLEFIHRTHHLAVPMENNSIRQAMQHSMNQ